MTTPLHKFASQVSAPSADDGQLQKILPYLISGGAGAALGGVMSGKRRKKNGEGRLGYLGRVLKNALVGGGLAAGGHALIGEGVKRIGGGAKDLPVGTDDGPMETGLRSALTHPITAVGAGLAGLGLTRGGDKEVRKDALKSFTTHAEEGGKGSLPVKGRTPKAIAKLVFNSEDVVEANRQRRLAGLPSSGPDSSKIKKIQELTNLLRVNNPSLRAGDLLRMSTSEISTLVRALTPENAAKARDLDAALGMRSGGMHPSKLRGAASWVRRVPMGALMGQSHGRLFGRTLLGTIAAGIPTGIAALTTSPSADE